MIQVIIHESSLQTIKINVCGFRPDGAYDLDEPSEEWYLRVWAGG
jgi:hypothetical protein